MRLEEAAGQVVCPTLFGGQLRGVPYDEAAVLADLARFGWGGYILFHGALEETRERVAALQRASRVPLLVASDMEQGAGQQVAGLSAFPPAMAFGATGDPALAFALGAATAREARSVGINWVFAPVADVATNPANPIIGIRSFGGDPARVAELVAAFVSGCQSAGALACAKHFPGHGDTETDSHTRLGTVAAGRDRLEDVEWPPFAAAIAAGVASVMSAHLAIPALGVADRPATVSRAVMTGVLRDELGFDGLVVTDALLMGGVTGVLDPAEAGVLALAAGCDMLLMPPDPRAQHAAIVAAVKAGTLPEARLQEAAGRVLAAKRRLGAAGQAPTGDQNLAETVAARALTLAKGRPAPLGAGVLAVALDDGAEPGSLAAFEGTLARRGLRTGGVVSAGTGEAVWRALFEQAESAEALLLGVFSPVRIHKDRAFLPAGLVETLGRLLAKRPSTVVSFSNPFLVAQFPEAANWLLTYGARPVQVEAAVRALVAGGPFPGVLPVRLPASRPEAPEEPGRRPGSGPAFA